MPAIRKSSLGLSCGFLLACFACSSTRPAPTSGPHTPPVTVETAAPATDWEYARIALGDGPEDDGTILLENAVIRIRYAAKRFKDGNKDHVITDFFVKKTGTQLLVGDQLDGIWMSADEGRGKITSAHIVHDGPDAKTIHVEWAHGKVVQEFSIYPDLPILRIDYIKYGINIVDMISSVDSYEIYGALAWQKARERVTNSAYRNHPNPHHRLTNDLYPRYPFPILATKEWGDLYPAELVYHDHLILGCYLKSSGVGFGRVYPVHDGGYIKLLKTGYEVFANWKQSHERFTGYLYAVTGGSTEILSLGKAIVDGRHGDR